MACELDADDGGYVIVNYDNDMTVRVYRNGQEIARVGDHEICGFSRKFSIEERIAMALALRRAGGLAIAKQAVLAHG